MKLTSTKTIYWIGAALTSLWFGTSGICELTKNKLVWDITLQLGYPPYFIYVLGVAKLAGIVVLLIPNRLLRLKEWVFAGIFFDIIFAFFSKLIVIGLPETIDAIVAFLIVATTYLMFRRIHAVSYSIVKEESRPVYL
ncbi:DoxX family protein [Pedobacter miscanthi]|uniref:DoxX family protein n=1 Tax=Pedobacter miscanthi TaxID=2259170 RepID=A0A366LDB6_9SPHI|nr:DoxX family protein [Pedobacter miscanthi]RBQ11750.1 DoxX family protein [Pedobacter miscanthi]